MALAPAAWSLVKLDQNLFFLGRGIISCQHGNGRRQHPCHPRRYLNSWEPLILGVIDSPRDLNGSWISNVEGIANRGLEPGGAIGAERYGAIGSQSQAS